MKSCACKVLLLVVLSLHLMSYCAHFNSPRILTVFDTLQAHKNYNKLNDKEKQLVLQVIELAAKKENSAYYVEKLLLLLNTPYESKREFLRKRHKKELKNSVIEVTARGSSKKEQPSLDEGWYKYRPDDNHSYYYVSKNDPLNISIRVRIEISAMPADVTSIHKLENAIEEHLAVPGFNVDIVWADHKSDDVVTVTCNPNEWATAYNWVGGYETMAHELMHVFGLRDEYNRIDHHAGNRYITIEIRLRWFIIQMADTTYDDAEAGIMWHKWNKPLPRHVCWAVGLGDRCISIRTEQYGSLHDK